GGEDRYSSGPGGGRGERHGRATHARRAGGSVESEGGDAAGLAVSPDRAAVRSRWSARPVPAVRCGQMDRGKLCRRAVLSAKQRRPRLHGGDEGACSGSCGRELAELAGLHPRQERGERVAVELQNRAVRVAGLLGVADGAAGVGEADLHALAVGAAPSRLPPPAVADLWHVRAYLRTLLASQ